MSKTIKNYDFKHKTSNRKKLKKAYRIIDFRNKKVIKNKELLFETKQMITQDGKI